MKLQRLQQLAENDDYDEDDDRLDKSIGGVKKLDATRTRRWGSYLKDIAAELNNDDSTGLNVKAVRMGPGKIGMQFTKIVRFSVALDINSDDEVELTIHGHHTMNIGSASKTGSGGSGESEAEESLAGAADMISDMVRSFLRDNVASQDLDEDGRNYPVIGGR